MEAILERLSTPHILVDLGITVLLFVVFNVLFCSILKNKKIVLGSIGFQLLILIAFICNYTLFVNIAAVLFLFYLTGTLFLNMKDFREFFIGQWSNIFPTKTKVKGEKLFDRETEFSKVATAVGILSKQKVGALITFEREDSLEEAIKSGTTINSPISVELLQTIFYPGTRLHDGAVIIRGKMIVAASAFFTPSTTPLKGKYGSRHRAALGISETTDSVTLIVSEETGRISIAYDGELETVSADKVLDRLTEYMEGK